MIYLAKALIKTDQEDKAKEILQVLIQTSPSSSNYIEDSHYIHEAKTIWDENF